VNSDIIADVRSIPSSADVTPRDLSNDYGV